MLAQIIFMDIFRTNPECKHLKFTRQRRMSFMGVADSYAPDKACYSGWSLWDCEGHSSIDL